MYNYGTTSRNEKEETLFFKSLSCMQRYAGYAVCDIRIILFEKVNLFQKNPTSTRLSID